jgi:uncharacterized repeat protein (TIGR03803 family)
MAITLGSMMVGQVTAQAFTTLYSFGGNALSPSFEVFLPDGYLRSNTETNRAGEQPLAGLLAVGTNLYGSALSGGNWGGGTIFRLNTDGTGFEVLHTFSSFSYISAGVTNLDGDAPECRLILSGNTLYGTALEEGAWHNGTIYKVNVDGTGFETLHTFSPFAPRSHINGDGAWPNGGLSLYSNVLYGTTQVGGGGGGVIFRINTDGTGFKNLHDLCGDSVNDGLLIVSNVIYGKCGESIFRMRTDGTGFGYVHTFTGGADGCCPGTSLAILGDTLFGVAEAGGAWTNGTVFSVKIDGSEFRTLHNFGPVVGNTNVDGLNPKAGLIRSGNTLYGTTRLGGPRIGARGTLFKMNTDGSGFETIYAFSQWEDVFNNQDGAFPSGTLALAGDELYGTASGGGAANRGTVFRISLGPINRPQLSFDIAGSTGSISWPATSLAFTLEEANHLEAPIEWKAISSEPSFVNGRNVVTVGLDTGNRFYRLVR